MDIVALTANHPLPDGQVTLLGAVDSVTGAMTQVETGGAALLVDCGIAQGREAERWRFPEAARDVDAVILTHGHNDHVGSLSVLLEGGFEGPIVGTRATLASNCCAGYRRCLTRSASRYTMANPRRSRRLRGGQESVRVLDDQVVRTSAARANAPGRGRGTQHSGAGGR